MNNVRSLVARSFRTRPAPALALALALALACDAAPPEPAPAGEAARAALDDLRRPLGALAEALVAAHRDNDESLGLVLRLEVVDDLLLEIYEPEPDEVLVVWSGAPTEDPGIGSDVRTLAELWAALADDAPMPPALAELALHVGDRPLGILGPSATDWIRAAEHRQGFCDRDFLKSPASACSLGGGLENDYTLCVNDQWDGIEGSADPTYVSTAVVCPNLGDVVLHFYAPDAYGLWPVPLNTYWQGTHTNFGCIKASDPGCHYNTHTVEDAEGDRFHFRMIADLAE
ncbi:MAG: hypothetical protein H6711_08515 [Myxococcales bacterium]|nr:hypothetical protein [Myxococcales bacterium]